jgi:hypothetical protein
MTTFRTLFLAAAATASTAATTYFARARQAAGDLPEADLNGMNHTGC